MWGGAARRIKKYIERLIIILAESSILSVYTQTLISTMASFLFPTVIPLKMPTFFGASQKKYRWWWCQPDALPGIYKVAGIYLQKIWIGVVNWKHAIISFFLLLSTLVYFFFFNALPSLYIFFLLFPQKDNNPLSYTISMHAWSS